MNPYGRTKFFLDGSAMDIQNAELNWKIVLLCYCNLFGTCECSEVGEDPKGTPNHLMTYTQQVVSLVFYFACSLY